MDLNETLSGIDRKSPTPAHAQIASILIAAIEAGNLVPGTRLPPERALCSICGVSRSTVRQALDAVIARGLIEKHQGRGIFVTAPATAKAVGCVLQSAGIEGKYQWGAVLTNAFVSEVRACGWEPITYLLESDQDRIRLQTAVSSGKLQGILTMISPGIEAEVPTVYASISPSDWPRVYIDYYSLVHQAASHLARHGCRRIGLADYGLVAAGGAPNEATREGRRAYSDVLRERGLTYDDELVVGNGGLEEQGAAAVRHLWALGDRPDGLIFMDDWQGLGGTRVLDELRASVPGEVMVVTHMNRGYTLPYPVAVTGIRVDPHKLAREMVLLLDAMWRGESNAKTAVYVEPELIEQIGV